MAYYNIGKKSGKTNCGNEELIFLATAMKEGRGRRLKMQLALNNLAERRRRVFNSACLQLLLISQSNMTVPRRTQLNCFATKWREEREIYVPLASSARNIHAWGVWTTSVCRQPVFLFSWRQVRTGREILVSNNRWPQRVMFTFPIKFDFTRFDVWINCRT